MSDHLAVQKAKSKKSKQRICFIMITPDTNLQLQHKYYSASPELAHALVKEIQVELFSWDSFPDLCLLA